MIVNASDAGAGADALQDAGRLLIVDTTGFRPHLETSLEIALSARERGATVRYRNLRAALPRVEDETWLPRPLDVNALRVRTALQLLQDAGVDAAALPDAGGALRRAQGQARQLLERCGDVEAVKGLRIQGFDDLGWCALSSVIDVTRNPQVTAGPGGMLQAFVAAALFAFERAGAEIAGFKPDAVLLFNGRFAATRGVFRAARAAGVRALIHERGCDRDHYWIATDLIHDPDYLQSCVRSFWRPDLRECGEAFFRERRERVERAWYSFTRAQEPGRLPGAMGGAGRQRWVVFFTSSEDEYAAIGDKYRNPAFPTQVDAIKAVAAAAGRAGARLCVRVHPHVAHKSRAQVEFWRRLALPDTVVVQPGDPVDSYALLDAAHVVATYGSTVGVEATFWGKPSVLLARSIYDLLGVAHRAHSTAEIERLIREARVLPRDGALMYGAFFGRFGTRFRHFRPEDLFAGSIAGRRLDDAWPVTFWRSLKNRHRRGVG